MPSVALITATAVLSLIHTTAHKYGVDPDLVAAVVEVESHFNPNARGSLGERGLLQLRPEYFDYREGDVEHNLNVGVAHLASLSRRCPTKADFTWVICHNLGVKGAAQIKNPKQQTYYKRIMTAYEERKALRRAIEVTSR